MNRDPITGEPGSHPLGTGLGSAGGAAAGATVGAMGGPVGMAIGGVVGAIAGGLAGHEVAEAFDPTAEDAYWSENYLNEPYYKDNHNFSDYGPAYRMGYGSRSRAGKRSFDDAESELAAKWQVERDGSRLEWKDAREAVRAGWHRVERALPGDADHDGR